MPADVLADTGALLASLDKSDEWHEACRSAFRRLPLPLLTSEAVLTELFHMIGDFQPGIESVWQLLHSGLVLLAPIEHSELHRIHALMSKYSDRGMDFADATLVYLAERESIDAIFTVDQRDFSVYRIAGKRRFQLVPAGRP